MSAVSRVVVLITAAAEPEARRIAEFLLTKKKAACVNIVAGVDSHFWWQGKLDSTQESLLIVKTSASLLPEIIDIVKGVHSYRVPEIIAMPIVGGNEDYLQWLDSTISA